MPRTSKSRYVYDVGPCAPRPDELLEGTCFTLRELREIIRSYNTSHPKEVIPLDVDTKALVSEFRSRVKRECSDDDSACWLRYSKGTSIEKRAFKKRVDARSELSAEEIDEALYQIESIVPEFWFMNAVPSDVYLEKVWKRYVRTPRGKKSIIAIVFNTLPHTSSGEHWTALVVDKGKRTIEYYDPTGDPPNEDITRSIDLLSQRFKIEGYSRFENTIMHQPDENTVDCGVYVMTFITERLRGESFGNVTKRGVSPIRERFFRVSSEKK